MPIPCPAQRVTYKSEEGEILHGQGCVSLPDCIECKHNKGYREKGNEREIMCGYNDQDQIIQWMPI